MKKKTISIIILTSFFSICSCTKQENKALKEGASYEEMLQWAKERTTDFISNALGDSQNLQKLELEYLAEITTPSEDFLQNKEAYEKLKNGESATVTVSVNSVGNEQESGVATIYSRRELEEIDMKKALEEGKQIDAKDYAPILVLADTEKSLKKADGNQIVGTIVSYVINEEQKTDTLYRYFFFGYNGKLLESGVSVPEYSLPLSEEKDIDSNGLYRVGN